MRGAAVVPAAVVVGRGGVRPVIRSPRGSGVSSPRGSGVMVGVGNPRGSGVVVTDRGDILTSLHVVADASAIQVTFADGTKSPALVTAQQPDNDIAVLRATQPPAQIVPATLGNPSAMRVGDEVFAVGNPLGLYSSMSAGVISGFDRSFPTPNGGPELEWLIQFDAAVNPGNSGGPLLNIEGRVIGINTMIFANAQGIGFAIPVDRAKKVIQDIVRFGQVHSAWIGAVTATAMDAARAPLRGRPARRTTLRATCSARPA